jgi:conjugal transfer pilus assembly protein TraK
MLKVLATTSLVFMTLSANALSMQSFKDNTDVALTLSDTNYNRLVVRGDKITKAHFPEGALGIKNEEDGSLYVMTASASPFTLFLTTESGHHFSATITSESALGKTIEFVPQTIIASAKPITHAPNITDAPPYANEISSLMTQMIGRQKARGFDIKHHFGRVTRLQQGLRLMPKFTYNGVALRGEIMELYNGSKLPLDIQESWFADEHVKAVSLSTATLAPKQKAIVYRISEQAHG